MGAMENAGSEAGRCRWWRVKQTRLIVGFALSDARGGIGAQRQRVAPEDCNGGLQGRLAVEPGNRRSQRRLSQWGLAVEPGTGGLHWRLSQQRVAMEPGDGGSLWRLRWEPGHIGRE